MTLLVLASRVAAGIVAPNISEHLPWDAECLRQALARLSILG